MTTTQIQRLIRRELNIIANATQHINDLNNLLQDNFKFSKVEGPWFDGTNNTEIIEIDENND